MDGIFITIEGPDGAGKTTVIKELSLKLKRNVQKELVLTREPGGIPIAEQIRQVILDPQNTEMDVRTEALLYAAARRQHLVQKILPALAAGKLVLCDRFVDSSLAYQGAGRSIGIEEVAELNHFATEGLAPDFTLYLDVDAATGLKRIQNRRTKQGLDRLDAESEEFHKIVQEAYLEIAKKNPKRICIINAYVSLDQVVQSCYDSIRAKYPKIFQ